MDSVTLVDAMEQPPPSSAPAPGTGLPATSKTPQTTQPGGLQPGLHPTSSFHTYPYQTGHMPIQQPGMQPSVQGQPHNQQQQQMMHQQQVLQQQQSMQQQQAMQQQQQAMQHQRAMQQQQATQQQQQATQQQQQVLQQGAMQQPQQQVMQQPHSSQQQQVIQQQQPVQQRPIHQQQYMQQPQAMQQQPMATPMVQPPTQEQLAHFNFNPASQGVLQSVGARHSMNYEIQGFVHKALKDVMAKAGNPELPENCKMEYQTLLDAILLPEEAESDHHVAFCKVVFQYIKDTKGGVEASPKPDMTQGQMYLTNQRVILLSSEETKGLNLTSEENVRTTAYNVSGHKMFSLRYESIPLACFRGVDMSTVYGFSATARVQGFMPSSLESWLQPCCSGPQYRERWQPQQPLAAAINNRVINLGVFLPPWETRCNVQVYMSKDIELAAAVDFIDALQQGAPSLQPESFSIPRQ